MQIDQTAKEGWEHLLPLARGVLPLGGTLRRTEPSGSCPAPIVVAGLYPAHTKMARYKCIDGATINLPSAVEERSFEGSKSAMELVGRYLDPLGLSRARVLALDIYPYFLANTHVGKNGRSMWDNVQRFHAEAGVKTAVEGREPEDEMVRLCRTLPGNAERLAHYMRRCRPALVVTLGNEVAAYVRGYQVAAQAQHQLYGPPIESAALGFPTTIVHLAHPGLFLRRSAASNAWVARHDDWCAGRGKTLVQDAIRAWDTLP
jgi:hypothetical protein